MTRPVGGWWTARRVYVGTVLIAGLAFVGVYQVDEGAALAPLGVMFVLTLPLSIVAYPILAYGSILLAPETWGTTSTVFDLFAAVLMVAGSALVALVQFELVRAASRCIARAGGRGRHLRSAA